MTQFQINFNGIEDAYTTVEDFLESSIMVHIDHPTVEDEQKLEIAADLLNNCTIEELTSLEAIMRLLKDYQFTPGRAVPDMSNAPRVTNTSLGVIFKHKPLST